MAAVWMAIDRALRAVIGAQGAAAIYTRSLHLAAREHLWLLDVWREGDRKIDIALLRAEMAKRDVDEAASAAQSLLQTFDQLFANLIGASLMDQLLRSVFEERWGEAPNERCKS